MADSVVTAYELACCRFRDRAHWWYVSRRLPAFLFEAQYEEPDRAWIFR